MRELICINCPLGCHLTVNDEDKNNIIVTGNTCKRGERYGIDEVLNPKRMVTSSVKINGGIEKVVSVKTREAIPKELIFKSLDLLKDITLEAPVKINDVVIKNVLDTGVDFIVTKNIDKVE